MKYYTAPEWSESAAWDWKEQPPMLDPDTASVLCKFLDILQYALASLNDLTPQFSSFLDAWEEFNDV